MIKIIKSSFITKIVFSYIDEEQKLKFINYNKYIQKIINISIIIYKYFTRRYIIYKSSIKGGEYNGNDDKIII